jgi:hypothetical protein
MPSTQHKPLASDGALAGSAPAGGRPRKPRSPAARLRRFMRKLFRGSRPGDKASRARPGEDEVFEHLWRTAAAASDHCRKLSIDQPNVLLFQMGKVASLALEAALIDRGINCFHSHFLGFEKEASRLSRLFQGEPNLRLAAIDLKLLARHTALNMLTRWYRGNQVAPDRKLKVITLTRDPVTWYVSQLLQHVGHNPRRLSKWHRDFSGAGAASDDVRPPASELLRQVGRLIVESRPSVDLAEARKRGRTLAMAMDPPQPYIADNFRRALVPLDWFDQEFRPVFDVDIRALREFADQGLARRDLGFADVLIVRFEDLAKHMDAIVGFVGLASLELPRRNVTAEKPYASQILDAARVFQATELGIAFQRELRRSDYGRACGYDRSAESGA